MAMSEYRKLEKEQNQLDRKLKQVASRRAGQLREEARISYCMHTPKKALRQLEERSRSRSW